MVDQDGNQGNHAEVDAEEQSGGQRVGHTALENQVGVHQPVADDGPTEGQGEEDQRQPGEIGEQPGRVEIEEKRNGGKEREWDHRKQSAPGDPFQLLA